MVRGRLTAAACWTRSKRKSILPERADTLRYTHAQQQLAREPIKLTFLVKSIFIMLLRTLEKFRIITELFMFRGIPRVQDITYSEKCNAPVTYPNSF